jgi:hypothetical protein
MAKKKTRTWRRAMNVMVRRGSKADKYFAAARGLPGQTFPRRDAIAPGARPSPLDDLIFHGGATFPQMRYVNLYVGGEAAWDESDVASIEASIKAAMTDKRLNNVVQQYFVGATLSCATEQPHMLDMAPPSQIGKGNIEALLRRLQPDLRRDGSLDATVLNVVLPRGTVLTLDDLSSRDGLGGYHSSIVLPGAKSLYYSANVYSEGRNGIVAFDRPWKNVVATLYHEINEFRTDADVQRANDTGNDEFLGWLSRGGEEIGDQPIRTAFDSVFKQVTKTSGTRRIPVQFLYSNAVHGPEGPIAVSH